ncbi:MAG TPA: ATP-binding cassette domain-containing protein [Stellaceae bacterium]|nr:ATP-binding cassette domain-containing protein [Stellaceae bacterium]
MERKISLGQFIGLAIKFMLPYRLLSLALAIGLVLQVVYNILLPLTYRYIFDGAIKNSDMHLLLQLIGFLGIIYVVNGVAGVIQDYTAARVGSNVTSALQERLFKHLQSQDVGFFTQVPESEIVAGFGPDITAIDMAIYRGLPSVLMRLMTILSSVTLLFVIEWRLAVAALVTMPIIFFASKPFAPRARVSTRAADDTQARIAGMVQENILVNLSVRIFNLQSLQLGRLKNLLDSLTAHGFRAKFMTATVGRAAVLAAGFLQIVVLGIGAYLTVAGFLTSGLLIAFIGLLLNIGGATDQLTQAIPLLVQGASGLSRILGLLDRNPSLTEAHDAQPLAPVRERIALEDVEFGYGPAQKILKGVSLSVPMGKSVGIVGGSGSGKSTVLMLMTRLYDPESGRVVFDNHDLRQATEASLRAQTGVVLQNTALFNTTIRDNIRMGRQDATDTEVEEAARQAGLHDFVMQMPDAYETNVGSQGSLLSGGQRQRVAIARALLRRPAVLFLDEATSALDAQTEAQVNETIDELASNWTLVSVTHRLASISNYDLIFVMDKGLVAESGSHHELVAKNGIYANLWRKQSGFSIDQTGEAKITVDRLRNIPFLEKCTDPLLEKLANDLHSETFPAGRVVFSEGERGDKFYIIARGRIEASVLLDSTTKHVLSISELGDYFGELALIRPVPRTWTMTALTDSVCLTLSRQNFTELLAMDEQLRDAITATAYARMEELSEAILAAVDADSEVAIPNAAD